MLSVSIFHLFLQTKYIGNRCPDQEITHGQGLGSSLITCSLSSFVCKMWPYWRETQRRLLLEFWAQGVSTLRCCFPYETHFDPLQKFYFSGLKLRLIFTEREAYLVCDSRQNILLDITGVKLGPLKKSLTWRWGASRAAQTGNIEIACTWHVLVTERKYPTWFAVDGSFEGIVTIQIWEGRRSQIFEGLGMPAKDS